MRSLLVITIIWCGIFLPALECPCHTLAQISALFHTCPSSEHPPEGPCKCLELHQAEDYCGSYAEVLPSPVLHRETLHPSLILLRSDPRLAFQANRLPPELWKPGPPLSRVACGVFLI